MAIASFVPQSKQISLISLSIGLDGFIFILPKLKNAWLTNFQSQPPNLYFDPNSSRHSISASFIAFYPSVFELLIIDVILCFITELLPQFFKLIIFQARQYPFAILSFNFVLTTFLIFSIVFKLITVHPKDFSFIVFAKLSLYLS